MKVEKIAELSQDVYKRQAMTWDTRLLAITGKRSAIWSIPEGSIIMYRA